MRRTSIGIKLAVAFAFLVFILIGIGWLGLSRMGQINANLEEILARQWTKVELAREIEFYANQNSQIATDFFLLGREEDHKLLLTTRQVNRTKIANLMNSLKENIDSDKEKELFDRLDQTHGPFVTSFGRVMELVLQNKQQEARTMMLQETIPLREKFYTARENFMRFEEQRMNEARYASEASYAAARRIEILLISMAIVMATVIAVFVTLRMSRGVSQREEAKAAIRVLNEDLERKVVVRTEELANAIRQLQVEVTDRKQIEAALRLSEQTFRSLVENSPYGILRTTTEHKIQHANRALLDMLGYDSEEEIVGLDMGADVFRSSADHRKVLEQYGNQREAKDIEVEWKRKDGTPFTVRYGRHSVADSDGNVLYKEIIVEDITEKRGLEHQLRQAQKMEAIGRLAGGVAHDFNNLLGVIIGYSELLLDRVGTSESLRAPAEQIKKAGDRASSLTRQLLAFSRQQVLETRVLNLNTIVSDMQKMLPRLLGEDVEIRISLLPELGNVKADQGQIEQVIMNLAVNARDAMPGGGKLTLETTNVELYEIHRGSHPAMPFGHYILLTVSDTGIGMDAHTLAHIFEPFFTTKGRGRGTGLGLATVYGVIKQSGGYIWAESEPGQGATFKVYLPRVDEAVQPDRPLEATVGLTGKSQTLLLVEDEESLRTLTRTLLQHSGYTVLEAGDGRQAIEIARQHIGPIDLLLTDVVMPGMNGRAVAQHLMGIRPGIGVVYMSGYTDFGQYVLVDSGVNFLQKPFTRETLLRKLDEAREAGLHPNQSLEPVAPRA
jgi:PAS domain S-box-containing protein